MKTEFLGVMALIASIFATTACQKDKTDDTWKNIPTERISVESGDAIVEVNDVPCTYGNVQLVADGEDAGTLTLTGIVPGYQEVKMPVELLKKSDDTFAIKGSTIVSTPPSIAATIPVRSTCDNPCYALSAEGTVKIDGTVDVAVTTQVQNSSAASLAGTWALVRRCEYVTSVGPKDSPLQITWKLTDGVGGSLAGIINLSNVLFSSVLSEVLDQVTFDESGNITARYWPDLDLGDDPLTGIFKFGKQPGDDGYYDFTASRHTDWVDSPKANLAFWYATGNSIYVVPNVAAIIGAAGGETSTDDASGFDLSEIMELLSELQELGVDVNTLNTEIQKALQRGVELKYSLDGENLKIYADKELCAPVIEALLPALPVADAILEQLAQSTDKEDKETYAMLQMLMRMIGIKKPSDLADLWKATTEFEIALNFTKA